MADTKETPLKERLAKVLAEEVAPLVQMDDGDIELVALEDGVAQVRLHAACLGCPGTVYALIMSIEEELRRRVPEVVYLEVVP